MSDKIIAPDGKPYDIVHLEILPTADEVEVIQYLRPDGKRRRIMSCQNIHRRIPLKIKER